MGKPQIRGAVKMPDQLTFGSLFSGIGGFDLGFERGGMRVMAQVERDRQCRSVLSKHWPEVQLLEDVTDGETARSIQRCKPDLLCGGFPCQDLSVAGKRAGLAGERSGLWFVFRDLIARTTPRWVCIENVPGLLSSQRGRDMGTVLGQLGELGYGWAYRVLDSQWFGIAQRRERVFIVGCHGDARRAAEVLFEPPRLPWDFEARRETRKDVAPCVRGGLESGSNEVRDKIVSYRTTGNCGAYPEGEKTGSLNTATDPNQRVIAATLNSGGNSGGFRTEPGEHLIAHTLRASGHDASEDGTGRGTPLIPAIAWALQNCDGKGPDSSTKDGHLIPDAISVRRLMPVECERLQGFPDDWTRWGWDGREISDSARYRMLGNAVSVPVAEWIGRRIVENTTTGE